MAPEATRPVHRPGFDNHPGLLCAAGDVVSPVIARSEVTKQSTRRNRGTSSTAPVVVVVATLFLPLLLTSVPAHAFDWNSLWLNDDQRAARQMQRQEYAAAAGTFDDAAWRAAAWYRAGEYGKAAEAWSTLDGTEAHYNRGNALARAGRLHEAAAVYETVLERDPDHADARHNLAVIREHMQDSQNQSEQQQQQDGENRDSDQEQNSRDEQQGEQRDQQRQQQQDRSDRQPDGQRSQEQRNQSGEDEPPPQQAERNQAPEEPGQQSEGSQARQSPPRRAGEQQADEPLPEQRAATEQWLRRIPDDPGGLLRRKFRYQYGQRRRADGPVEQPW